MARYITKGKPYVQIALDKKQAEECIACAGSGYYDDNGSPPCGACNGTGKNKR